MWAFPVHRTKIYKIWAKFNLLRTFPCSVVFFHSAIFLDVSFQFVVHPKTFSLSHDSFPANCSSRRQLGGFLMVVFRVTSDHLSPNPQPGGSVRHIYIPRGRLAYPKPQTRSSNFRRLLRHTRTTLDLVLAPTITEEKFYLPSYVMHDF